VTEHLLAIFFYTTIAGLALPAGGAIAAIERIGPRWLEQELRHGILAFGGGVLLSAVALVLVPHGTAELAPSLASASLILGGISVFSIDRAAARSGRPIANLLAGALDFAPEAIALGALLASDEALGALLALFIGLQNLPEGFNAYREMAVSAHIRPWKVFSLLTATAALGPFCGLTGYWLLSDTPHITAAVMLFASGGILYLVFQDIAPQARLSRHWGPPLGAVLGFALGLIGTMLIRG